MTDRPEITDIVAASTYARAEEIAAAVLTGGAAPPGKHNGRLDRIITSRTLGFPLMLILFAAVLWLTIYGADLPSGFLAQTFFFTWKIT